MSARLTAEQNRYELLIEFRAIKLIVRGIPEEEARRVARLVGPDAIFALYWTRKSWALIQRALGGSRFSPYQREVHALFLLQKAWTAVVDHPGSNQKNLADMEFQESWIRNQTMHLSLFHLALPDPGDALRSLRVLRAGLIILPTLL